MARNPAGWVGHRDPLPAFEHLPGPSNIRKRTPKRPREERAGLADIFPYYAGFSFEWAQDQLQLMTSGPSTVLDPWNGSGTTTLAAISNGHRAIGADLNPIANVVARLRMHAVGVAEAPIPPEVPPVQNVVCGVDDPLLAWLSPTTVRRLRDWAEHPSTSGQLASALKDVSLFRVVRRITQEFEGTNPTWVRRALVADERVDMSPSTLDKMIIDDLHQLRRRIGTGVAAMPAARKPPALLLTASANQLPLMDRSVDLILTSPPYLTRIDYAVAYSRELAIMGVDIMKDRTLREALMGTTLIRPAHHVTKLSYGRLATDLLHRVSTHQSKASAGYYLKQVSQYLSDLQASLQDISRVAKSGAKMALVVQDSYYKDVHIPLAKICIEESERRGWQFNSIESLEVNRLLTYMNTAARKYPKGRVNEAVAILTKE